MSRIFLTFQLFIVTTTLIAQNNSRSEWNRIDSLWESAYRRNIYQQPINKRILYFAQSLLDTPYQSGTLDGNEQEQLIVCLSTLDCVTYVENVLALTMLTDTLPSLSIAFSQRLQRIRYLNGKINGFASRLHYSTAWLNEMEKIDILTDVTPKCNAIPFNPIVNYMSHHYLRYAQLCSDSIQLQRIQNMEQAIRQQKRYYIPKEHVDDQTIACIQNGDIILITTNIKGLDVSHLGIAVKRNHKLYLLHASSKKKRVIETQIPLKEYLYQIKNQTGIIIVRSTGHSIVHN